MQLLGSKVLREGDRVYFTSTVANIGNAYDTLRGHFEAPYRGTYLFTVQLCINAGNHVIAEIIQDGNVLAESLVGDGYYNTCSYTTAVTFMEPGSRVWAGVGALVGGTLSNGSSGKTSFTGVLLNNYQIP